MALLFGAVFASLADEALANHSTKPAKKSGYGIPSQVASYLVPTSDPNVVYNNYAQTGGQEIRTKDSYFAHCQVWVKTTISKSFANGSPRINPDATYYPGDGFEYSFSYGWDGNKGCRNLKVCPVESSLTGNTAKCDSVRLKPLQKSFSKAWSSSVGGMGEIPVDNASGHFVQLTVEAERFFCIYSKKSKIVCGWSPIVSTGSYWPNVLKPKTDLMIAQEFLRDKDGFISGNMDKTYYLWDAINLVHNPTYKWKHERLGTISILVTKQYSLKLEKEFQCEFSFCNHILVQQGFEPWQRTYQYGSGTTLMNATTNNEIKKHLVYYKAELFNLGRLIDKQENKTEVLVVRYDPAYDQYPYLLLKDGHAFSWGNRPAVAIHYLGSNGGGQDDQSGIHEKRRSKINLYDYSGYAFNPIQKKSLGKSLLWAESRPIVLSRERACSGVDIESDSFEGGRTNTAMFIKKGYGKIIFSYSILYTMLDKRYVNATIDSTLQSLGFAGIQIKNLTHYKYQYPDTKFGNPVKVLTYDSYGKRTNLPVSVKMIPDAEKGAQYTHEYVCKKILRDTKSREFAEIVVNDMYNKTNQQNGTGYVTLKSKLTSTWFPELYHMLVSDVMGLDLNVGYGVPSPYEISVAVGEKTRTIKRIVAFLSPFTHVVNLDTDNSLNVTDEPGLVRIHPDNKFGEIIRVTVNGNDINKNCSDGCTIVNPNHELKIEAWNLWAGRATAIIHKPSTNSNDTKYDWDLTAVAIFVAIIGWILHRLSRQAINYFRNIGS